MSNRICLTIADRLRIISSSTFTRGSRFFMKIILNLMTYQKVQYAFVDINIKHYVVQKRNNELEMYHFLVNISYFTPNIFSILIVYISRYIIKNLNKIKLHKNDNRTKKIQNLHFSKLPTWSTWPWLTLVEAQGVAHSYPPRPRTFNTLNI